MPDLRFPTAIVAREFMDEDDRRAGPGFLTVQFYSVVGDGVWHRSLLSEYSLCSLCVERLWENVKYEDLYLKAYDSIKEVKNEKRKHRNFDRKSPAMVYYGTDIISKLIRKEYVHP
jgi:hypothetical protein